MHAASGKKSVSFCCGQGSSEIGSCFEAQQSVSHCLESLTSVSAHIYCSLILCMPPFATDMHSAHCNSMLEADASK